MSAPPAAGPAGFYYADVPNRAIAYIIDAIILFVINIVVGIVLAAIIGPTVSLNANATDPNNLVTVNYGATLIGAIVSTAISGAYFVYTWTSMRASPGQKILGMQVGNESDGATLTMNQAVTRWILLGAPFGLASALNPLPVIGLLIGLAGLVWFIALLVTTAQSPTKQGLHDRYAHTVVVKAARAVG
ncbi:MAG TPA: RDD family protein [Candidatus Limnocylindrales bacterium]|nr:RDD family protein [Candidatus Limnocylindrales bacterium]